MIKFQVSFSQNLMWAAMEISTTKLFRQFATYTAMIPALFSNYTLSVSIVHLLTLVWVIV